MRHGVLWLLNYQSMSTTFHRFYETKKVKSENDSFLWGANLHFLPLVAIYNYLSVGV